MRRPGSFLSSLTLGLGMAATVAGSACGPTCPTTEPNCGTSVGSIAGAAGTAGAAGSTATGSCDLTKAIESCMNAFCATASNPFCNCWTKTPHFDINSTTCLCAAYDPQSICDRAKLNGVDATTYDCAAQSSAQSSVCIGVQ